jgi:DNA invertase Pin-like site-specific DNA recombinase
VSGARPDRRELLKLLKALTPGDVVTVTRIDRLARSIFDLFAIVKQIVDAGGNSARWPKTMFIHSRDWRYPIRPR